MKERESFREENLLTDAALQMCGFEVASHLQISKSLYRVLPDGKQSVMYDAMQEALNNFVNLNLMLQQSGTAHKWQLSLVVVLSGPDRGSKINWNAVLDIYQQTKKRLQRFRVVFVAYDVRRQTYEQLFFLEGLDKNEPTSIHLATSRQEVDGDENIGRLMQRIREELGLKGKGGSVRSEEEAKINPYNADKNYGVMVVLNADERYRGESWIKLCHGIQTLIKPLGDRDLFGCIVYSDQIQQFSGDKFQPKYGSPPIVQNEPVLNQAVYNQNQYNQPQQAYFYPQHQQLQAPLLPLPQPVPADNRNQCQCCKCLFSFLILAVVCVVSITQTS